MKNKKHYEKISALYLIFIFKRLNIKKTKPVSNDTGTNLKIDNVDIEKVESLCILVSYH